MYGVVRNRFVTSITKNQHGRRRLPLNPNNRKISTTSSPASQGGSGSGSGWIEKLRRSRIFASVIGSLVGSTATFQYMSSIAAAAKAKAQEKPVSVEKKVSCFEEMVKNTKLAFPFDENDLIDDQSIRKLYERWLTKFGITRRPDEKEEHYQAFKNKAYYIYFFNKLHTECILGLTIFGDMTDQELKDMHPPMMNDQFFSDPLIIDLLASQGGVGRYKELLRQHQGGGDIKN